MTARADSLVCTRSSDIACLQPPARSVQHDIWYMLQTSPPRRLSRFLRRHIPACALCRVRPRNFAVCGCPRLAMCGVFCCVQWSVEVEQWPVPPVALCRVHGSVALWRCPHATWATAVPPDDPNLHVRATVSECAFFALEDRALHLQPAPARARAASAARCRADGGRGTAPRTPHGSRTPSASRSPTTLHAPPPA
jgi:hypothetical protein